MNVNTKKIIKGIITVDGNPIRTGMSLGELERILHIKIKADSEHVGYVIGSGLVEDEKPITFTVWFKDDKVRKLDLNINGFYNDDEAYEYLNNWLENREITEWVGDSYYRTEFGSLIPRLVRHGYGGFEYEIDISFEYEKIPERKFTPIKANKSNTVKFVVDDFEYKIQRIPFKKAGELPFLHNILGDGPQSLTDWSDTYSKDDRQEVIYFIVSKIDNNTETVLGVAEFTYFAIWDAYENSELFIALDSLAEHWGIVAFAAQEYGCGLQNKNGITPYLLVFETIHDEVPHNKELELFRGNKNNMKLLFDSAIRLASKYVKIPEEDMTLISVSSTKDNMFSYYKKVEDTFINYQRTEKNATVTKASGNASKNSLKYQLNIPSQWAKEIGLQKEDKSIVMEFDGETISIRKQKKNC